MGFTRERVIMALTQSRDSLDQAMNLLLAGNYMDLPIPAGDYLDDEQFLEMSGDFLIAS